MKLLATLVLIIISATLLKAQHKADQAVKHEKSDVAQTVTLINTKLVEWCENGNIVTVTSEADGNIRIKNRNNTFFIFNVADLAHSEFSQNDKGGIEIQQCDSNSHAPLSWINFNTSKGNVGFIRLQCNTPVKELELIRKAFLQLRYLYAKNRYPQ